MNYRHRRRSLTHNHPCAKPGEETLYVVTTKLFGLSLSDPKEASWIVVVFFLALSLFLPSRLLLLVIYLLR
jgi:hypothetical protein